MIDWFDDGWRVGGDKLHGGILPQEQALFCHHTAFEIALRQFLLGRFTKQSQRDRHDGMTMLCVTHEMGFARKVADLIVFMDEGQTIEQSAPDEFSQTRNVSERKNS